ncbi:bacteriohemerythrin [Candidatus Magnetaquicoccus inordinatus]|uniref:bacteriohemerythrin n=1 Tax=Candidatus Magnetaquicoccus inordinatus TaxID=2496818 RepID=UPI00102B9C65|nr:bacteriohemerythrin [Candidatus Magnetaquicoccus inordinatus]
MSASKQQLFEEYLNETSSRGILLTDEHGNIIHINQTFFSLLGLPWRYTESTLLSDFLQELPLQKEWQGVRQEIFLQRISAICNRSYQQIELFFRPERWLQWTGREMSKGGYALTVSDVSRLHLVMNATQQSSKSTIKSMADMAENRDNNTGEHVLRVARMTHELALDLLQEGVFADELDESMLLHLGLSSMLHDVGKVAVSDGILLKPGILSADERRVMQTHAEAGHRMIRKIQDTQINSEYFASAALIALHHHECWDGSGYPHGLLGEEIPVVARIVAVSDVFDALTSWRPYKEPWAEERAVQFLREKSAKMFDPRIVEALQRVLHYRRESQRISWDNSMSVGDATLDNDHHILIDLINQLGRAHDREDGIVMEFVVDELYNYTVRHFQREEEYMRRGDYPHLQTHQSLHQQFAQRVVNIRHQFFRNFDPALVDDLTDVLGEWLQKHILGADKDYQSFFAPNPS